MKRLLLQALNAARLGEGAEVLADDDLPKGQLVHLGRANPLSHPQRFRLVATNLSAIPTRVAVSIDEFCASGGSGTQDALAARRDAARAATTTGRSGRGVSTFGAAWQTGAQIEGSRSPSPKASSPGSPGSRIPSRGSMSPSVISRGGLGDNPFATSVGTLGAAHVLASRARRHAKGRLAHGPPMRLRDPEKVGGATFKSHMGRTVVQERGTQRASTSALTPGKGLALALDRHIAELPPMSEASFEITAHCNMPGVYTDLLRVQAQGTEEKSFPLQVTLG